jgi:hypothetical protein
LKENGMAGFVRLIRSLAIGAAVATLMVDASMAALTRQPRAKAQPEAQAQSGTVRIEFVKAGLIVGVGSGSGTLTYRGKSFRLTIGGVELGSVGISTVQLTGTADNLHNVSDIAGTYNAVGSNATIGGGSRVATVRNEKGVVLKLRGRQSGLQASLGLSGMTITLQQAGDPRTASALNHSGSAPSK